jgi:uncharacterized membrane protein YeaQ/YmgE (transglycosylase-associated protein family)
MSLFAWLLLGLLSGFIASHLVNHRGEGMVLDILLGIVGAVIGGWLATFFGFAGVTALNPTASLLRWPARFSFSLCITPSVGGSSGGAFFKLCALAKFG